MIRGILSAFATKVAPSYCFKVPPVRNETSSIVLKSLISQQNASFTSLAKAVSPAINTSQWAGKILLEPQKVTSEQIRTVIRYSWKRGTRKSVKAVVTRFYRLNWGIWIRTMAGRHRKLWKKSSSQRNRLSNHVFCNATQSKMLDKMTTKFWRKPKHYIEDPYAPYHTRENFFITQKKPWRPEGVDYE